MTNINAEIDVALTLADDVVPSTYRQKRTKTKQAQAIRRAEKRALRIAIEQRKLRAIKWREQFNTPYPRKWVEQRVKEYNSALIKSDSER